MHPLARLKHQLDRYHANHLIRERAPFERGTSVVDFISNDYLALTYHRHVKQAFIAAANKYGVGSGASPQLSGYTALHQQLEEAFAEKLNRERALLFNSGYHANLGVITTLATRNSTIISDKYCHASILDAICLSRAKHKRYSHNNMTHANELQLKHPGSLVVSESVFSIQGTLANIAELTTHATQHNNVLIIDDAHGIGILGKNGGGVCEHFGLSQTDVPCLIAPLGKAFASMGAIVSGRSELIEALLQFARPYRYSTAIPAAICAATLAAMHVMQTEPWRLAQLRMRIGFFIKTALERELTLSSHDLTPVKSIIVHSNLAAIELQAHLKQIGFLVACIRPPTIPAHLSMIRISLHCDHTEQQIVHLLDEICAYGK